MTLKPIILINGSDRYELDYKVLECFDSLNQYKICFIDPLTDKNEIVTVDGEDTYETLYINESLYYKPRIIASYINSRIREKHHVKTFVCRDSVKTTIEILKEGTNDI